MIKLSYSNLFRRKTRTIISLLAIVIGVMVIIVMVSLADGQFRDLQNAVSQVQGIRVLQKGAAGPLFSEIDMSFEQKLESVQGVKKAIGTIFQIAQTVDGEPVQFGTATVRIIGSDYSKGSFETAAGVGGEIIQGRSLKATDSGVVVVGEDFMDIYNKFLNNKVKVNGETFRIVGVYKTGSALLNSSVLMTLNDSRDVLNFSKNKTGQFSVEVDDPSQEKKIAELINLRFKNDLEATPASGFSQDFAIILDGFRLLVVAVAGISAIVAGIGIVNTMLMSVLERFKEIGSLKAGGWTNENVMKMVLFESIILGIFGGLIGIILGVGLSLYISFLSGLKVFISEILLIQVFLFSVSIGLFAGLYPAYMASKMDPVEALRVE